MLLVCHDMYVLQAGDYYTFGTIAPWLFVGSRFRVDRSVGSAKDIPAEVFTVLVIAMNYRAAFLTRTLAQHTLSLVTPERCVGLGRPVLQGARPGGGWQGEVRKDEDSMKAVGAL